MVRKIFNVITTIVLVLLIVIVVFVFISRITGNVPTIFGYSILRVQTNSMEPTLMVGDIILSKSVQPEEIKNGDIITYKTLSGPLAGNTITHRVAKEPEIRNGVYYYVTKGDRQGAALDSEITYDQVKGKYIKTLPFMDKIYSFFLSPYGLIVFVFIIIALFGYEMISLILSYRSLDEKGDDYYAPPNKKPSKKRKK